MWWDEVYMDPFSTVIHTDFASSSIFLEQSSPLEYLEAAMVYARYVSKRLEDLETSELSKFILNEPPPVNVDGLTPDLRSFVLNTVESFNHHLAAIHFDATLQSMQKAAIKIRQMEKAGVRVSSKTTRRLAPDPVTAEAYTYDPETRILLAPNPAMGMKGIRIKEIQEGRLLDVVEELITTDEE